MDPFQIPELCPVCSAPTTIEGDFLYCRAKGCPAKLSGTISSWIEKLGLLYWGDALIASLTNPNSQVVNGIADLYRLTVEQLSDHCSGVKMATKCYDVLHNNKSMPIEVFLSALSIQNLGIATATDIVQAGFDTVDKILALQLSDLLKVKNIGEITASVIIDGIESKRDSIVDISSVVSIKKPVEGGLNGKSFCITGELSKPRKLVEKMIIEAGGVVKGSVSMGMTYLVTNDSDTGSSKMQKAKKYGITVINENELMKLLAV
jgi:DNA ligase (NAD+)